MSKIFVISLEFPAMFRKFFFFALLLSACQKPVVDNYVVRVHDNYLTREELRDVIPFTVSPEDSAKLAINHINNWIRKQVVLNQAELNLSDLQKDVQQQLEEYKNDLVIYKFESQLIKQKLDTAISNSEIKQYYDQNKEMFKLKDYALRVAYIRTEKDDKNIPSISKELNRFSENDSISIYQYCEDFAVKCYLNTNDWVYLGDLISEIPLTIYNAEQFLKRNTFVQFDSDTETYLLKIFEYKLKDNFSPLELEHNNIRSILLNAKKMALLENMREDLFNKALKNGDIEIVEN